MVMEFILLKEKNFLKECGKMILEKENVEWLMSKQNYFLVIK